MDFNPKEEDVFNILVATDIHLGFAEKDPIRGEDTFITFEEILQAARDRNVDFILLGGDLFHEAKPTPYCLQRCIQLLEKYCLGDRPVAIELLSDPSRNFTNPIGKSVNYESPNLNIAIPVFSIHGNHDDAVGRNQTSALDLVASAGLVNYFGRCTDHENVDILPILLKKGESQLALYGLSHVKDERLGRLFLEGKVKMEVPPNKEDWFHLLVWHQNRANRGAKNFIPDSALAGFLDLVIWGHEHDNRLKPESTPATDVWISQPGSSVATSLSQGESIPKQVGLLKIHKNQFNMTPIDLKTVRPFIYKEMVIKEAEELLQGGETNDITKLTVECVKEELERMIEESKTLGRIGRASKLPLLRLIVRYHDDRNLFNTIRLGQTFVGRVANPDDMIKCHIYTTKKGKRTGTIDDDFSDIPVAAAERVEDLLSDAFKENDPLKVLPYTALNSSVRTYISTENSDVILNVLQKLKKNILRKMEVDLPPMENVEDYLLNLKIQTITDDLEHAPNEINQPLPTQPKVENRSIEIHSDDENVAINSDEDNAPRGRGSKGKTRSKAATPARSRRGTGRGTGRGRGRGAKRGAGETPDDWEDSQPHY